ncbi:MAG TPA: proton-conducting transporter membrane subunit [Cyclobacteriaceae bacterium]|nr:proton-conducting transporter membrane subunit [Cyclobacteriaceae bacterium]
MNFWIVVLSPVLALVFLPVKFKHRGLFYILSLAVALFSIFAALQLAGTEYSVRVLGLSFVIDSYARVFLVLICCTWFISIIYSYEFTKYHFQEKRIKFFLYLNTLLTVACLNACSGSLTTLFILYVIGIPLTYPLLTIRENAEAIASGKKFFMQTMLPSFLIFLPAIFITQNLIGQVSFDGASTFASNHVSLSTGGIVLALFVIGISKNSVFPFHTWLPSASPAPAPVSGLIHSVATVKTGSIALIKIATYIFGLDYIHQLTSEFLTGGWITYLCGATAVYTAYRALKSDDLKTRFGFSTVGQLSYIILAILVGTKLSILAAVLHIITHAIAKSCLFYVAGFYNSVYHSTSVRDIQKFMPHTRFVAFVIAICGLSITGFPFLAGFYSKDMMLIEEWNAHYYSSVIFLVVGSIVNILYIIGPVRSAFKKPNPEIVVKPIPWSMTLTFLISIGLIVGSNYYVPYIITFFD